MPASVERVFRAGRYVSLDGVEEVYSAKAARVVSRTVEAAFEATSCVRRGRKVPCFLRGGGEWVSVLGTPGGTDRWRPGGREMGTYSFHRTRSSTSSFSRYAPSPESGEVEAAFFLAARRCGIVS